MKRSLIVMVATLFVTSCQTNSSEKKYCYKAIGKENIGLLTLTLGKDYFFGTYERRYGELGKDVGEVRGNIIGDTLRGKYKYISYGGNAKIEPFLLLKDKEILKLGSGSISTFMNIPYYIYKTIEFKDTNFQFHQIDMESAKKFNFVVE